MEQKRPRGRPKGTQINDGRYLDQVADLMLKEPKLKKTPAIARIVAKHFPDHQHSKIERRLLRKWNETHEARMDAARERRADERQNVSMRNIGDTLAAIRAGSVFQQQAELAEKMRRLANPAGLEFLKDYRIQQAARMQQLQNLIDPPALRRMREATETLQRSLKGIKFN